MEATIVLEGLCRGFIGIVEKKMETTIVLEGLCKVFIRIMENKIVRGYMGYMGYRCYSALACRTYVSCVSFNNVLAYGLRHWLLDLCNPVYSHALSSCYFLHFKCPKSLSKSLNPVNSKPLNPALPRWGPHTISLTPRACLFACVQRDL